MNKRSNSIRTFSLFAFLFISGHFQFETRAPFALPFAPAFFTARTALADVRRGYVMEDSAGNKINRKASVSFAGIYQGQMSFIKKSSFNGFTCTPTQSFAFAGIATEKITSRNHKVTLAFGGGSPITAKGAKTSRKSFKVNGTFKQGAIKRNYELKASAVSSTGAVFTLTEVVSQGKKKGCLFKHSAVMSRS